MAHAQRGYLSPIFDKRSTGEDEPVLLDKLMHDLRRDP